MATEATVDRRAAIVRAAYELVAEHGLGGLTHRRTAERAGVALGLTTYYFGSADELAGAALEHAAALAGEGLHSWAERIRATDDLPGTLAELILDRIDDRLRAVADLELQLAAAHRPGLRPLPLARIEGLAAVLAGRVGTDAARAAVAYVDGTVLTALVTGERPDRDAPAAALAALLDVRPETGRRRRPPGRDRTVEQVIGDEVRRIRQASGATLAEMAVRTG
ncbi:TetR/AcrR family transcriptional regulator, partial [Pseudonocardia kongjuensis]|uniref:TetR/AcrR family transcriptional regulator n=1 Tax=Pseudonocardia kongjuensis TaxID=102227 RepID=UPI0031CE07BF